MLMERSSSMSSSPMVRASPSRRTPRKSMFGSTSIGVSCEALRPSSWLCRRVSMRSFPSTCWKLLMKRSLRYFSFVHIEKLHYLICNHVPSSTSFLYVQLIVCGLGKIDINDWKSNTRLKHCTPDSNIVKWFWKAVESFDEERRARLLQFVTGSSRVPLQGFKALQGKILWLETVYWIFFVNTL